MEMPLPSNDTLIEYSSAVPWQLIEERKRTFNDAVKALAQSGHTGALPLDELSNKLDLDITAYYPDAPSEQGNVIMASHNGHPFVLGSMVSARYRSGKSAAQALVPFNFNPSVNHTNLHETDSSATNMRALGAELELGLMHPDGRGPSSKVSKVVASSRAAGSSSRATRCSAISLGSPVLWCSTGRSSKPVSPLARSPCAACGPTTYSPVQSSTWLMAVPATGLLR